VRGSYGRVVEVDLGENYRVRFGHLNDISVVQGEALKAGDTVGTVGASGRPATGPHLHFEVLKDGKHIDPEAVAGLVLFGG
jgi:murein DD-endopeptidase MepM/ murein hydrolase activator NlpD